MDKKKNFCGARMDPRLRGDDRGENSDDRGGYEGDRRRNGDNSKGLTQKDTSILIGNALDHYDSAIYGLLAPVLAPLFFPNYDPIVQLILAYSVLGTSLVTRPLGSLLFGVWARHSGPVSGMAYSLMGVAFTTVCLGFLPTYKEIGWMAPTSLIALRMIKGIFAAGESTIAKLYIMENKSAFHALKASYLYQSSSMMGTLFASIAVMGVLASFTNAWRYCFWIGGVTGIMGYILRRYSPMLSDVKAFTAYQRPKWTSFWHQRTNILRVALATGFGHITGTLPFVFMNSFVPLITSISLETMMFLNTFLLVLDMMFIPLLGKITLRYEGLKVMIVSSLVLAISLVPLFAYLPNASVGYVIFVRVWIVFWGVVFMCPMNFWFKSLFAETDQYLFVGMGGALGAATMGRLMTPVCLWLWYASGAVYAPALFVAALMVITAYGLYTAAPYFFQVKGVKPQTTGA